MNSAKHRSIDVTVKYVAGRPFHDNDASQNETLASLKRRVLTHFGLEEVNTPEFKKTYNFHDRKGQVDDLAQTLGQYAERHHEHEGHGEHGREDKIELKLVEQIVQGLDGPPPSPDALLLEQDFNETCTENEAVRWQVTRPGWMEVWATLSPRSAPSEKYHVRLLWQRYRDEPPSLKFRDALGRLDNPRAWPLLPGFRPTSLDACVNFCAEGFALHPEWKNDARTRWDSRGNSLLRVLTILQTEFDERYSGRFVG
jgi:hypothetical protein